MNPLPCTVWRFHDAPQELRDLSTNGGDEDWLVEVPPIGIADEYGLPEWILSTDSMEEPKTYPHPTRPGWTVVIGAHA